MTNAAERDSSIVAVFDRSAATYEQLGPRFFGPIGRELARRAALRPGERVLDVGCGRGHCLFPAAAAVGPQGAVVGLDLAPSMVEATAEQARNAGLSQVTVKVGDAAGPEVEPGSFDVLLAGLVIFFLPDPVAAARNWARALKPDGRLALTTFRGQDPNYERLMKAVTSHLPRQRERPSGRPVETFRNAEPLTAVLTEAGLRDIDHQMVTFETRFTDRDQWWEWIGSHGGRAVLERLPEDRAEAARTAAYEVMESSRTAEGGYAINTPVRYTTARP